MIELGPGANAVLPDGPVTLRVTGRFDLSALVLGADGRVGGDGDLVFYNAPSAPGVRVAAGSVEVAPQRLRRGAERVVVVASPDGSAVTAWPRVDVRGADGRGIASLVPPPPGRETALLLAEIYPRATRWRVRAIGQGYADGLAGLARDFGVEVDDEPADNGRTDGVEGEVVRLTNAERAAHRLAPLAVDAALARAAYAHSGGMAARRFFAHRDPDGREVWDRAAAAGYRYRKIAENIAAGRRTAVEVVRGWMDSPGHRANILDPELTQIGVGRAEGGEYGVYWTQVFGTPR